MKITNKIWRIREGDLTIEISLHGEGEDYANNGRGVYCYYIYIYERKTSKEKWDQLWLEDELVRIAPDAPERVTHNYNKLALLSCVDFHYGITFYAKHGHSIGHRSVQLGCDYNHLWDAENIINLEDVIQDAKNTARQILTYLNSNKN